ncbi:hypothetical protein D917_06050 [Trichinella nativa]|uniref:RRM domain-containing protein n=1 Tax=Trichinella nativa TaxID=6335 RepID=A0A1Y3EUY4_9BILA|nr:hypothetical protein D917_06050 [Trichinella nativa]
MCYRLVSIIPNLCYLAFVDNWESSTLQLFQTVRLCNECLYPIRKNKKTGLSNNYALIRFRSENAVQNVLQHEKHEIDGKVIKVEMSKSANSRFEPEIEDDIEELGTG